MSNTAAVTDYKEIFVASLKMIVDLNLHVVKF